MDNVESVPWKKHVLTHIICREKEDKLSHYKTPYCTLARMPFGYVKSRHFPYKNDIGMLPEAYTK
jgi:hypothetical protein